MPSRARLSADTRRRSVPPNRISPEVAGSRPMMHFSSVVLPMPLRPIRQVRDPSGTTRSTSQSVWLPPYDWLRAFRISTGWNDLPRKHENTKGTVLYFFRAFVLSWLCRMYEMGCSGVFPWLVTSLGPEIHLDHARMVLHVVHVA